MNYRTKITYTLLPSKLLNKTFLICISGVLFSPIGLAQEPDRDTTHTSDTPKVESRSADTMQADSTRADSTKIDSLRPKRGRLEAEVKYTAVDSIDYNLSEKKTYLVNQASITYKDMNLKAGHITIDWANDMVYAYGMTDTTGATVQKPVMTQAGEVIYVDTIAYNIQTRKAVIQGIRTETQEGILYGDRVKRLSDSLYYIKSGKYTTDKAPEPDYYIKTQRIKYIPGNQLITGPAQMYIHDVPTPLVLPFGYFPTSSSKRSGVIIPHWGEESNSGFFLQGMGYYLALSDYIDLKALFDIYSKGTYGMQVHSNYKLRYRFSGNLSFIYQNHISGTRGLQDYSRGVEYRFIWNHDQDEKANPNLRLSAHVDISSSRYFKDSNLLEDVWNQDYIKNTNSSSIDLTKTFDRAPFKINLHIDHSQDLNKKHVEMTLPRLQVNLVKPYYPFAPKTGSRKGILNSLSLDYSLKVTDELSFGDSLFFHKEMFDSARAGAQHSISTNTSTKLLRYLSWSFSGDYSENWGMETTNQFYNPEKDEVETRRESGFASFRTFGFSTSLSTTLYGTKQFKKGGFIQAIRHMMIPTLRFSYRPDFWSDFWGYTRFYRDGKGKRHFYTPFANFPYSAPGKGRSSLIGFNLENSFEAKVRRKADSGKYEKVKLLDQLNLSSSYNLAADSFRLADIDVRASTTLLKSKLNINFAPTFSAYKIAAYKEIDELTTPWLKRFNLNMHYSMDNTTFGEKSRDADEDAKDEGTEEGVFNYDTDGYAHYTIPWHLDISYSFTHRNSRTSPTKIDDTNTLNFNGNIGFSPFWKVSFSSGYNVTEHRFIPPNLKFERQLRSFVIRFNWSPSGARKSYYFFIGIRSDILKDLKYDRRSPAERNRPPF